MSLIVVSSLSANDKYSKIISLNGYWKFNIGDNQIWANVNYNDKSWDNIIVPSRWENEGYNGYNGFAWYRKEFDISSKYFNQSLYLSLGSVDDVAEIYINGNLIGISGSFPPKYESAYNKKVWINIPTKVLNKNKSNIISVRVYDGGQAGGIYNGDIGIFISEMPLNMLVNLEGEWKFKLGDDIKWKESNLDDSNWKSLHVPLNWDSQGYKDYDGFAWYRIKFNAESMINDFPDNLIILLGKIDDVDQTFLNGNLIGSTGDIIVKPLIDNYTDASNVEYKTIRGYRIKKSDLKNGLNTLAIRVFDGYQYGGIYEGPIGITSLNEYLKYISQTLNVKKKDFIQMLFE
ncbi:MAG: beta galactosidase jelly roll domain-containing protein [Ignavibacteriae bacterium]|nr:beta galactosidase jelly roll domain-containing protein [Ignavibacteriota bacterium]